MITKEVSRSSGKEQKPPPKHTLMPLHKKQRLAEMASAKKGGKKRREKSLKSATLIFNSLKMFNRIYFMPVGGKDRKSNRTLF